MRGGRRAPHRARPRSARGPVPGRRPMNSPPVSVGSVRATPTVWPRARAARTRLIGRRPRRPDTGDRRRPGRAGAAEAAGRFAIATGIHSGARRPAIRPARHTPSSPPAAGHIGARRWAAAAGSAGSTCLAAEPTGAARRAPIGAAEPPRAPWHPFPLTELCVLIGLVLLVWGVIRRNDPAGRVLLVCGMALAAPSAGPEYRAAGALQRCAVAQQRAGGAAGRAGGRRAVLRPRAVGRGPLAAVVVFAAAFAALRRAHRRVAPAGRLG